MTQPISQQQPPSKPKQNAYLKWVVIVVVVVVIIAGVVVGITYHQAKPKTTVPLAYPQVYASTSSTVTGTAVSFSILNVTLSSVTNVTWKFGDGTQGYGTNLTHEYQYPGYYLVQVIYTSGGKNASNIEHLFPIQIAKATTGISSTVLSEETNPVILFNTTINPTEPIFNASSSINAIGGYLEAPTAANWTISAYNWVLANKTSTGQYFNTSYSETGLYPIFLNVTTSDSGSSLTNTYIQSIYIQTSVQPAAVIKGTGAVSNPTTITDAEVVPGGPYCLDPQIDWETVGMEPIRNVYQTLVAYNGSSTTSFDPVLVTNIPTIANGEVSSNGLNWTFAIRTSAKFADGNSLSVFDVYFSMVREMLFTSGSPGTGGYTLAQALLPGYATGTPGYNDYTNITNAITYDNSTQTITFHLFKPVPYFLTLLADTPSSVMEYSWAAAHGAGLTFTPQGFSSYMQEANANDYNQYLLWNTMGTGPFTVSQVQPGESITLTPNTYYVPPAYGFPKSNYTIVIDYVKEATTAVLLFQDGQADIISNLPTSSLPSVETMVGLGQANTYTFPTMTTYFYPFNFNINTTMLKSIGTQYTVPSHYFANLQVRQAFVDAFNYSEFLNDILGNSKYHITLGSNYVGLLPPGMLGYKPLSQWLNLPNYNLSQATQLMHQSGEYNVSINIPIFVSSGDTTNYAAVSMWALALEQMDPNIVVTPYYITFSQMIGYIAANLNHMPIYSLGWGTSIADPINMIPPMYVAGGFYLSGDGLENSSEIGMWNSSYSGEAQNFSEIFNLSQEAATQTNITLRTQEYQQANQIGINMTIYLYTYIPSGMWIYRSWVNGVLSEENPVVGGEVDTLFCYLSK